MSDTPQPTNSGRGCLFYVFTFGLGVPLILVSILAILFFARTQAAKSELRARKQAMANAGMPIDDESLNKFYEQATSDKYTDDWLAVLAEATSGEFNDTSAAMPVFSEAMVPAPGREWPEEAATRGFLNQWQSLSNDVTRLARQQLRDDAVPVRFPTEFRSVETLLPSTQNMRQVARFIRLRGELAIYDQDSMAARRSIEALLGCSHALSAEPFLVSQLVVVAIDSMALGIIQKAIEHDVLNDQALEGLQQILLAKTEFNQAGWKRALEGERAMVLPVFDGEYEGPGRTNMPGRAKDALYFLDSSERVAEIPTSDLTEFSNGLRQEEAKLAQLNGNLLTQFDSVMTSSLSPSYTAVGGAFIRQAMQHRLAVLGISARLFESRQARLPGSLEELAGVMQLEARKLKPLGPKPFGYTIQEDDALLWGFEPRTASETPTEPPLSDTQEAPEANSSPWLWRLRQVTESQEGADFNAEQAPETIEN